MLWLASISLAVTIIFLTLVLLFLRYSLAPFDALKFGLAQLETGKSGVRLSVSGATEFRSIAAALNSLGATLDRVKQENRELVDRLFQVQEGERKDIARDLHDEAGPCLFSIRATSADATGASLASRSRPEPTETDERNDRQGERSRFNRCSEVCSDGCGRKDSRNLV